MCHQGHHKDLLHALHEAKFHLLNCLQGRNSATLDKLENFQNMDDILRHSGGQSDLCLWRVRFQGNDHGDTGQTKSFLFPLPSRKERDAKVGYQVSPWKKFVLEVNLDT